MSDLAVPESQKSVEEPSVERYCEPVPTLKRSPVTGLPSRPAAGADAKMAAQVADRIIADVMALGWPVGEVLGVESDLLERYRVSRAVFREAVRLLEHREVARTRRGPGGGLVVTEPSVEAVIAAVALYLYRVDASLDEVFEARITLEGIAGDLAARRLEENDLLHLRAFAEGAASGVDSDPRALHRLVAKSSRNPAIELFVDVLNRVATFYSSNLTAFGSEVAAETAHAHAQIARAIIDGDSATARRRMCRHLQAEAEFLRHHRYTRELMPASIVGAPNGRGKMAEIIARHIASIVVAEELEPGGLIGTESELMEREGVSRAVLREAIRLLEYQQIARMRRGPGGGLLVLAPSPSATTDMAAIYLARQGMQLAQLSELRTSVEVAVVELAVGRIDDSGVARLLGALEREATSDEDEQALVVHDLHAVLASAAGNRVLELVAFVLIRLSRLHQVERLAPKARDRIRAEILRTHSGIAEAVIARDRELARYRMQRHLDALAMFVK